MFFVRQEKTNWAYLLIVFLSAIMMAGGVFYFQFCPGNQQQESFNFIKKKTSEEKAQEKLDCDPYSPCVKKNYDYFFSAFATQTVSWIEKVEMGSINIERIMPGLNSGLPEWLEVRASMPEEVESGFAVIKNGQGAPIVDSFTDNLSYGAYGGYSTFNYGENSYLIIKTINTGTGGPIEDNFVFIIDEKNKTIKDFGQNGLFRFYSRGGKFLLIGYEGNLYISAFSEGCSGAANCFRDLALYSFSPKEEKVLNKYAYGQPRYTPIGYLPSNKFETSLIGKDGKLYLRVENGYFFPLVNRDKESDIETPHLGNVDDYYLLDRKKGMILADSSFANEYRTKADYYDRIIKNETWKEGWYYTEADIGRMNDWLSPLLGRTISFVLAGEKEKAWADFDNDLSRLSKEFPLPYPLYHLDRYPIASPDNEIRGKNDLAKAFKTFLENRLQTQMR